MKFANIILAVAMLAGSSAFAAQTTNGQPESNSTCQHSNKTVKLTDSKTDFVHTFFGGPAAKPASRPTETGAQREGRG